MDDVLNRNLYVVKEHAGFFKAASNFDIFDPATGLPILHCREENLGFFTKMFRFHNDYKRMTKFDIQIRDMAGNLLIRVHRGITVFLSHVRVTDGNGQLLGGFKQKFFSIGGAFTVLDANDQPLCELKGKWTGWEFRFMSGENELARVTKKWAGLGQELFTSADNYVLQIAESVPPNHPIRKLILAAVMCIDFVLKE